MTERELKQFDVKSNDCLLNLNMSHATKKQKIQWLCQIIDNEVDKPENEQDLPLINEAADYLRELTEETKSRSKSRFD